MTRKETARRKKSKSMWERWKKAQIDHCTPPGRRNRERKRLDSLPTPINWPELPSRYA